jgi:biopolymer transport protein ExbB/TolQ
MKKRNKIYFLVFLIIIIAITYLIVINTNDIIVLKRQIKLFEKRTNKSIEKNIDTTSLPDTFDIE